jgi:hypothetical protein
MTETKRHVPTPSVSTRPGLYRPRWAAIIMLPKPTIVVVALTKMALMTVAEGVYGSAPWGRFPDLPVRQSPRRHTHSIC